MAPIKRVGLVGCGLIGAGWAARFKHFGIDVVAYDPRKEAGPYLHEMVADATGPLSEVYAPAKRPGTVTFTTDLAEAAGQADFIQESIPDREDLKREMLAKTDALAKPSTLIASSSSGLLPTRLQELCKHPERVLIGHPFNPVYLLPLVELLAGEKTNPKALEDAAAIYRAIGMHPLTVRKEVLGYLANRIQEAAFRECLHLINEGAATADELDQAIAYGPGLRWAFWGVHQVSHLAGGPGGMRHTIEHFGPAMEEPWSYMQAPKLTRDLMESVITQTEAQAGGKSVRELQQIRDRCLVEILKGLAKHGVAAGATVAGMRRLG